MLEQQVVARFGEVPVFFPAGEDQLFGVLTPPTGAARGTGVIVLVGGAYIPGTNRNRLSVLLARRLATLGFHTFRFDYHGVGESTGAIRQYDLDRPFVEDLEGAIGVLRKAGLRRLVLIGSCFGSRTLLSTAERVPELSAAVLMATPIQDFEMGDEVPLQAARGKSLPELARMALRPKTLRSIFAPPTPEIGLRMRRIYKRTMIVKAKLILERLRPRGSNNGFQGRRAPVSENFVTAFRGVVERGVPLLFLFGRDDAFYDEFSRAQKGPLRPVFARARAPVDVELVEGLLHGFSTLDVQAAAIERTATWLDRLP